MRGTNGGQKVRDKGYPWACIKEGTYYRRSKRSHTKHSKNLVGKGNYNQAITVHDMAPSQSMTWPLYALRKVPFNPGSVA